MEISSSNLSFRISMVEIDALRPHEEVVESVVESLADAMVSQRTVRDPLIVDRVENVILDGMHRFSALRRLGCRFAPCCLIDYDNPLVRVGAWFRLFSVPEPDSIAEKVLAELGIISERATMSRPHVEHGSNAIVMTGDGSHFSLIHAVDALERARIGVAIEKAMVEKGHHVDYLSEIVALQHLENGTVNFVVPIPIFTKQQIRGFGVRGVLLPHKVTRHVMPSRPLRIDIPLDIVEGQNTTREAAEVKLVKLLAGRRLDRMPPGSVVDGRRYEEELLVFSA